MNPKTKLLVALDVDSKEKALELHAKLEDQVAGFKIGSILFTACGPEIIRATNCLMLDLKFHDKPKTVAGAVFAAAKLGVKIITVHCLGGEKMMYASRLVLDEFEKAVGFRPLLVGVTVLTSHDRLQLDNLKIGIGMKISELAEDYAALAYSAGLDGVVCSPHEISSIRERVQGKFVIITPGIRESTDFHDDQARTMPVRDAVALGPDYIVVGEPVIGNSDPLSVVERINQEIGRVPAFERSA